MVTATLSHTEIAETVTALRPELVTDAEVIRNPHYPSMRLAVAAIDQSGNYKNFDVCVPLAVAYRPQSAAQRTLNAQKGHEWTVLAALYTEDAF